MNSLSAMQEVWAAIVASPGCCRLLAVSVEVAVLAVAVWCLIRLLRIRSARVCSLLWILVLAKGLFGLAFGAPLEVGALRLTEPARPSQSATTAMSAEDLVRQEADMQRALREAESAAGATAASASNGTDGTQPSSPVIGAQQPRPSASSHLSGVFASLSRFSLAAHAAGVLTAVWLAGVLWALLATALDLRRIRDLARASGAPSEELLAVFRAEAARLGIARVPALSVCAEVESPALAGFLRPSVLAPAWLAETADADQLRWMLAHELMHYKQKDTVGLLVRRAAQIALWFHPAVWWAGRQWEEAMERACDRALIAGEADARHYAEQLHGVLKSLMARRSRVRVVTGLFATRTQIGKRIAALLTDSLAMPARLSPSSATLVALFAAAALSFGVGVHRTAMAQVTVGNGSPNEAVPAAAPTVRERALHFPQDRSVGILITHAHGAVDNQDLLADRGWTRLGEARGDAAIPEGSDAKLGVSPEAAADLAFLSALRPDDLFGLSLYSIQSPDPDLGPIARLTGLQELKVCRSRVTAKNLQPIQALPYLRALSLWDDRAGDSALEWVAGLDRLEVLDASSNEISGAGLANLVPLASLRVLTLSRNPIDDEGIAHLRNLAGLKVLRLDGTQVGDAGLESLKGLTGLEELILRSTRVSDAGLASLAGLSQLRVLRLDATVVGDPGLEYLAKLPALEELGLSGTSISGAGLAPLARLPRLKVLDVRGTHLRDQDFASVGKIASLEKLDMQGAGETDGALRHLEGLAHLREISLRGTGDPGLASLGRMGALKAVQIWDGPMTEKGIASLRSLALDSLELSGSSVTDSLLPAVARLTSLKRLSLQGSQVSDAGLRNLAGLQLLEELNLDGTPTADASLDLLKGFSHLKNIEVGKIVSREGMAELKQALPNCVVSPVPSMRSPRAELAAAGEQLKQFYALYRLDDGEVLRCIAPPFPPGRADYYRREHTFQAEVITQPPDYFLFNWDGHLGGQGLGFVDVTTLAMAVQHCGLARYEFEGEDDLLNSSVPGDWIIRTGARREDLLQALEGILKKNLGRDIRIAKRQVERESIVARGKYKFSPIPGNLKSPSSVHLYAETLDPTEGAGGGSGTSAELLRWVGSLTRRCVVDETASSVPDLNWGNNEDAYFRKTQGDPDKIRMILDNLTKQTGLVFTLEKRPVDVWFVSDANPTVGLPDAAGAPVAAPAGGPTVPVANPAVPVK